MIEKPGDNSPSADSLRFDRAASRYELYARIQKDMAVWLGEWAPRAREGNALELAAGTGLFTRCLLPWKGPFLATDASPSMVETGKRQLPEVSWETRDADEPGPPAYDWIFSSSFLQWAYDPDSLLSNWRSLLFPGGRLLCGFFVSGTLSELNRFPDLHPPLTWRSEETWRNSFIRSGFEICRSESDTRVYCFPSALHLFRALHGVGATSKRQLSYLQMRRLLSKYDQMFRNQESVFATWRFFRVEARAKTPQRR